MPQSDSTFHASSSGELPVGRVLPALLGQLEAGHAILCAPPGSGKTTRVPLALLQATWLEGRRIVMLEPRRAAARLAAGYMASLLGEDVGQTVGYRVRFDQRVGPRTRIEVVTEGVLTRRLQGDPELSGVGLVIFDEFHERSLQADLGLALCLDVAEGLREDLRVLVMSATLDESGLSALLGVEPLVSGGRQFTIEEHHAERPVRLDERPELTLRLVGRALREREGDVLVFLPGKREIDAAADRLSAAHSDLAVERLHGELPAREQDRVLRPVPGGPRRVVLSTDVAETSVTIPGIRVVVDSGLARKPRFDPNMGLTRLETLRIGRDSAVQRAGRAGRLAPGACYRAWTMGEHERLAARGEPEILVADLAGLVLELSAWGVTEPRTLRWLDPPPVPHWEQAVDLLRGLDALDSRGRITAVGRAMVRLPVHPRLAHLLLADAGDRRRRADLAALLGERDPARAGRRDVGVDIRRRLDALQSWRRDGRAPEGFDGSILRRIDQTARRLEKLAPGGQQRGDGEAGLSDGSLLSLAYPDRIAQRRPGGVGRFLLASGREVVLADEDPLAMEDHLVVPVLDAGRGQARAWLAAHCTLAELERLHGERIREAVVLAWDETREAVGARRERRLDALVLERHPAPVSDSAKAAALLLEAVAARGLGCLDWSEAALNFRLRVQTLRSCDPGDDWPDLSDEWLRAHLADWLGPWVQGMTRLREVRALDLRRALEALMPWEKRRQLDDQAPETYTTPAGTRRRLRYREDGPPVLAVPLQEMFGSEDTPRLAGGRLAVVLHLLSPAGRPLQITQDLGHFWQNAYAEVRKDMRGRYPKHHWPEDPRHAEAGPGGRRRRPA
jgi:ATP-dependent helicase HrpB